MESAILEAEAAVESLEESSSDPNLAANHTRATAVFAELAAAPVRASRLDRAPRGADAERRADGDGAAERSGVEWAVGVVCGCGAGAGRGACRRGEQHGQHGEGGARRQHAGLMRCGGPV